MAESTGRARACVRRNFREKNIARKRKIAAAAVSGNLRRRRSLFSRFFFPSRHFARVSSSSSSSFRHRLRTPPRTSAAAGTFLLRQPSPRTSRSFTDCRRRLGGGNLVRTAVAFFDGRWRQYKSAPQSDRPRPS